MLVVGPWCRYQRDTARERFEYADGRNARQLPCIRPARHMHGRSRLRERLGCVMIGQPSAIGQSASFDRVQRCMRSHRNGFPWRAVRRSPGKPWPGRSLCHHAPCCSLCRLRPVRVELHPCRKARRKGRPPMRQPLLRSRNGDVVVTVASSLCGAIVTSG